MTWWYLCGLPVGAVFVEAHADGARAFRGPSVLGALPAPRKLFRAGDGTKHQGRTALRAIYPVQVIGPLTKRFGPAAVPAVPRCWRIRRAGNIATLASESYSPADASRLHEMVNPLLASKRCLRSSPLKKARRAFETDTGMVEPSCFTSTCVGPLARSSYENLTEYVCKVPPQFVLKSNAVALAPSAFPFHSIPFISLIIHSLTDVFLSSIMGSVVEAEEVPVG